MQIEGGESDLIETQRLGAVRQLIRQIGARPVKDRHKVVAHGIDTAGRQITQRLLIVGNVACSIAALGFNILMHRDTFHHRPDQPLLRQQRLTRLDLVDRPHLPVGNMVQRRHHAAGACLTHIIQRNRVIRPVPTPRLFHTVSLLRLPIAGGEADRIF